MDIWGGTQVACPVGATTGVVEYSGLHEVIICGMNSQVLSCSLSQVRSTEEETII